MRLWSVDWLSWLKSGCDRLRYHPVFKNPETEEQKQACQTCYDYVWHPEIGADKLYQKGKKRLEEENYEEALSILNLAIQFNADHADAYYHRGECYLQLNNQHKATEDFQKAAFLYQQQGKTIK